MSRALLPAGLRPWLVLAVVTAGFSLAPQFRQSFWSAAYLPALLQQAATTIVLATGLTLVIVTGGIDLSVGAVMALAGVSLGLAVTSGPNPVMAAPAMLPAGAAAGWLLWVRRGRTGAGVAAAAALLVWAAAVLLFLKVGAGGVLLEGAIAAALLTGAGCGLLNGLAITAGGAPPFIATLGMITAARGLTLFVTGGNSVSGLPSRIAPLGEGWPLLLITGAVICGGALFHSRMQAGRMLTAIGGNAEASRLSGVDVAGYRTLAYILCGLCAGIGAVLLTAKFRLADTGAGVGAELNAIAAAVLGGASLSGGRGSIPGTLAGALTISVLNSGLVLAGVHDTLQGVIIGGVIVLVVIADRFTSSFENKG